MAARLLEMTISDDMCDSVGDCLKEHNCISVSHYKLQDGNAIFRIVLETEAVEQVMDSLLEKYGDCPDFSIIVMPIVARLPRDDEETELEQGEDEENEQPRLSRDELYENLTDTTGLTNIHLIMVFLSTIVAAIGLLSNSITVIIGAMVIAPLLSPMMALALATLLADKVLGFRVGKLLALDTAIAIVLSAMTGYFIGISEIPSELRARTLVGLDDVVLALASGAAGVLSFSSGLASALVGVMVATALLPPLVSIGLFLGAGYPDLASKAFLVYFTNFVCISFTATLVLRILNLKPANEEDSRSARATTLLAFAIWTLLLALVVVLIRSSN